jgi:hypothetical protein
MEKLTKKQIEGCTLKTGEKISVDDLKKVVLEVLDHKTLNVKEITEASNAKATDVQYIINALKKEYNITAFYRDELVYYTKVLPCYLQEILHPIPDFTGRIISTHKYRFD